MEQTPAFFIPDTAPAEQEARYALCAEACAHHVLPQGERIYSITWVHNGEEWTATVGDRLKGLRRKKAARGKPARVEHFDDPAVVQAIFPGASCYRVVTNRAYGSQWVNPLLAGVPTSVALFSTPPWYFLKTRHTTEGYETLHEAQTALDQRLAHERKQGYKVEHQANWRWISYWPTGIVEIWIEDHKGYAVLRNAP